MPRRITTASRILDILEELGVDAKKEVDGLVVELARRATPRTIKLIEAVMHADLMQPARAPDK